MAQIGLQPSSSYMLISRSFLLFQAVTDKVTATTIQFRFVNPTDTGGLPIEAYAVEYKEAMQDWNEARRRVWPQSKNIKSHSMNLRRCV